MDFDEFSDVYEEHECLNQYNDSDDDELSDLNLSNNIYRNENDNNSSNNNFLNYDSSNNDDKIVSAEATEEKNDSSIDENEISKEKKRNWIPDSISLTTNDSLPIIYINSPKEKPEIYPIRLATITLNAELPINFNLKVISLYLPLDEYVIGCKCEQVCQRGWFKKKAKKKKKKKKKNNKGRKDKADFYNQCTLNVRPYGNSQDRLINMKLFPNGKVGFTGVKKVEDAEISLRIVLEKIQKLHGTVIYLPKRIEFGNSKNFKKKIKQRLLLLKYITENTEYKVDWDEFIENIITTGKNPYPNGLKLSKNVSLNLCILDILLNYFELDILKSKKIPTDAEIQQLKDVLKLDVFQVLFDRVKNTSKNDKNNFDYDSYKILCNYLLATQKCIPPLNDLISKYLKTDLKIIKTFIYFFLGNMHAYSLDDVITYLDENDFSYEAISDIKNDILYRRSKSEDITLEEYDTILQLLIKIVVSESNAIKQENIEDKQNEIHNLVRVIESKNRFYIDLPAWSTKDGYTFAENKNIMDYYSTDFINISNINTTFNTNFILNRKKLHQFLITKYNQSNCSLEPNYGGIKLSYRTNVDCEQHDDPTDEKITPEYNGCKCKDVSVLIFPNITLITGGRSFRQIIQAYTFIKNIMIKEFKNILKVDQNTVSPLDKYPNIISSNKYVYVKKKFVTDNQRNNFILKKLGLIKSF